MGRPTGGAAVGASRLERERKRLVTRNAHSISYTT